MFSESDNRSAQAAQAVETPALAPPTLAATSAPAQSAALPGLAPLSRPLGRLPGTNAGWAMRAVYVASDVAAIAISLMLAWVLVRALAGAVTAASPVPRLVGLAFAGNLLAWLAFRGLYAAAPKRPVAELRDLATLSLLATATQCALAVATGAGAQLLGWLAAAGLTSALVLPACRAVCRQLFASTGWWGTRVLVIGSGGTAASVFDLLAERPRLGLRPVGFIDDSDSPDSRVDSDWNLGTPSELSQIVRNLGVRRAVAAVPPFASDEIARLVMLPSTGIKHWIVLPPHEYFPSLWTSPCEVAGRAGLASTNRLASPAMRRLKRSADLAVASAVCLAALPLFGLIAVLVRLSSPGPVLYFQSRIGQGGRRFKMWKFRTMLPDADRLLEAYLAADPALRAEWNATRKLKRDPRVTWVGRWLRLTSLDELPQLWNILRGDMSLVGPRPLPEAEAERYGDLLEYRYQVPPGVTGLWQISGRNNTTYAERVDYDAYYVRNWSLWLDAYILCCTVRVVLAREGAY